MTGFDRALCAAPLLIAAAVIAGGCTPMLATWSQAPSVQAADIKPVVLTHPVRFAAGAAVLSAEEERRLSGFLASTAVSRDDEVTLVGPAAPANLADRRLVAIETALKRQDIRVYGVSTSKSTGESNVVTLRLARYVANPPRCADLSEAAANGFDDLPPGNFGCATANNIALMAAHPRDLISGAPAGSADATLAARAVELYRAGAITHSLNSASSGGGGSGEGNGGGNGGGGSSSNGGGGS